MSFHSPSRAVQQLSQLRRNGSSRHNQDTLANEDHTGSQASTTIPRRNRSWLNFDFLFRQTRREGDIDNRNHASHLEADHEAIHYGNQQVTKTRKYKSDLAGVTEDRRLEDRAKATLRAAGVNEMLKTADAMEICTRVADVKLMRSVQDIQDEQSRNLYQSEIRLLLSRELTDLRIAAVGLEYDPNQFLPEGEV